MKESLNHHGGSQVLRRSQYARSRETREKLLRATIEVLLEHGYAGLTTAQVDAQAHVSSGARVHHYRTKADLVIAATSHVYESVCALGQRRAEAAVHSAEPIRCFLEDCLSIYFDWPFIAALELVIAARTDPALTRIKDVLKNFNDTMIKTWLTALVRAGYKRERAKLYLRLTLNLVRGMAVNKIWRNDMANYDCLLDAWCAQVALRKPMNRPLNLRTRAKSRTVECKPRQTPKSIRK